MYMSVKQDWGTPLSLFNTLDAEFHFNLDAAASQYNTKVKKYLSIEDNALTRAWFDRVWLNPPFGRDISVWVAKALSEAVHHAECVVCLLPVRSDSRWWHDSVMKAAEIRLLSKRLRFEGATNRAPFPTAIVIFDGYDHGETPRLSTMSP
jgi:phage N-6-adenine-methyltransferase